MNAINILLIIRIYYNLSFFFFPFKFVNILTKLRFKELLKSCNGIVEVLPVLYQVKAKASYPDTNI